MSEGIPNETNNDVARRRRVLELTEQLADLGKDVAERLNELRDFGIGTADIVELVVAQCDRDVQNRMHDMTDQAAMFIDLFGWVLTHSEQRDESNMRTGAEQLGRIFDDHAPALTGLGHGLDEIAGQLQRNLATLQRNPRARLTPMERLIRRLFDEAPKLENADGTPVVGQAPALTCHVVLRSAGITLHGVLSETPERTLRMLTPTEVPDPTKDPRIKATRTVMAEQFFEFDDVLAVALQREVTATPGSQLISS